MRQLIWRRERPTCPTREPNWLDVAALAGAMLTVTVGLSCLVVTAFGWGALAVLWFTGTWLLLCDLAWGWLGWPE